MISKHQFLERISHQYGREVFLRRNLECLYSFINYNVLILPASALIFEAVQQCIQRSPQFLYEPLVVKFDDGSYRLLAMQKILLAHAQNYKLCMEAVNERNIALSWVYLEITEKNQQMLKYLQQVKKVSAAAAAVENDTFDPESLSDVAVRVDELGQLARVFQRMVLNVKAREQELADAKDQLEAVLNAVPGSISWIDACGLYISVNRYLAENWNMSQEAFIPEGTFILTWNKLLNAKDFDTLLRQDDQSGSRAIELLVLSACQTAAGDKQAALGLAGIAMRAGARSTLSTLWSVDDQSTAELMSRFYKELEKTTVTKAEALHRAQLALLKDYEIPYSWAPYVLVGNWL